MEIIFASHNAHKVAELQQLMPKHIKLLSLKDVNFNAEIEENGHSFEANAQIKCEAIFNTFNRAVFADDSGICCESLNGEPGVYSARFAGINSSAEENNNLLLKKLQYKNNRNAFFYCCICYLDSTKNIHFFDGKIHGTIIENYAGEKGFGYDPIFKPNDYDITFAQMSAEEKNIISHRGIAVKKFINFLKINER